MPSIHVGACSSKTGEDLVAGRAVSAVGRSAVRCSTVSFGGVATIGFAALWRGVVVGESRTYERINQTKEVLFNPRACSLGA